MVVHEAKGFFDLSEELQEAPIPKLVEQKKVMKGGGGSTMALEEGAEQEAGRLAGV